MGVVRAKRATELDEGVGVTLSNNSADRRDALAILKDEFKGVKYKIKGSDYIVFKNDKDAERFFDLCQQDYTELAGANKEKY